MASSFSDSSYSQANSNKELYEAAQSQLEVQPSSPLRQLLDVPDMSSQEWEIAARSKLFTWLYFLEKIHY